MRRIPAWISLSLLVACGSAGEGTTDDPDGDGDGDAPGDVEPQFPCAGADHDPIVGDALCLDSVEETGGGGPIATIEWAFEVYDGVDAVHVRLTMSPDFVDNSYGETALGWQDRGHEFKDLVGSDHAEIVMVDTADNVVFELKLDYISEDPDAPCGYSSLGPFGGDGKVHSGDESAILGWSTSLDQNLNERGYCEFTENSPATDGSCESTPDAPDWDFRMVYDVWVARSAFDPNDFGGASMDEVHASPSKGEDNTVIVTPGDCPDDWCNDPDGCDPGDPGDPDSCTDDLDCPSGEFCSEEGRCGPIIG